MLLAERGGGSCTGIAEHWRARSRPSRLSKVYGTFRQCTTCNVGLSSTCSCVRSLDRDEVKYYVLDVSKDLNARLDTLTRMHVPRFQGGPFLMLCTAFAVLCRFSDSYEVTCLCLVMHAQSPSKSRNKRICAPFTKRCTLAARSAPWFHVHWCGGS